VIFLPIVTPICSKRQYRMATDHIGEALDVFMLIQRCWM
jgi:hypothetical protein